MRVYLPNHPTKNRDINGSEPLLCPHHPPSPWTEAGPGERADRRRPTDRRVSRTRGRKRVGKDDESCSVSFLLHVVLGCIEGHGNSKLFSRTPASFVGGENACPDLYFSSAKLQNLNGIDTKYDEYGLNSTFPSVSVDC
jgi:hypothetical protein